MPRTTTDTPKKKRSLLDGYAKYDPSAEGYGSASEWRETFRARMSLDEAAACLGEDDPLTILGLTAKATWQEVKSAFRRLAKKFHPDLNPSPEATAKMQRINAAYVILEKRYGN